MFPTLIRIGDFHLATYGLFVAMGYLLSVVWIHRQRKYLELSEKELQGFIFAIFVCGILGSKLLYWLVEWRSLLSGEIHIINDFRYGFVFFGGVLGAFVAALWYQNRVSFSFLKIADPFAVALPLGHAIGRLGCLSAGCCWGKPTLLPWRVRFTSPEALVDPRLIGIPLHPTQVYESGANLLIAGILYFVFKHVRSKKMPEGTVFFGYVLLYSSMRFIVEFVRDDERGFFAGLSTSQWIALLGMGLGLFFLVRNGVYAKWKKN